MSGVKLDVARGARYSRHGNSLARKIAEVTGRTEAGAAQAIYGPESTFEKSKTMAWHLTRAGARELALRKAEEIVAVALIDEHVQPVTKACLAAVERPDVEEDVGRINLVSDDDWTKDELEDYLRLVDRAILAYHTIRYKVVARIEVME